MKKERILAYQLSRKLTEKELEDTVSGAGYFTQLGPCGGSGQPTRLDVKWDF